VVEINNVMTMLLWWPREYCASG